MRTLTVWRGIAALGLLTVFAAFTPADEPAKDDPTRATLVVHVPADAEVFVQGKLTKTTGETRIFWSPPLEAGKRYEYSFKASWKEDGKPVSRQEHATVKPGDKIEVDLRGPREPMAVKPPPEPVKPDPVVKKPDPEPTKKPDPEPVKKPDPEPTKPDPVVKKPDPEVKKPDPEVKKPDPEPTKKPDPVVKKPDPEVKKPDPEPSKKPDPEPTKPDPVVKKPDPEPTKKPDPEPTKKPDPEATKPDPVVKKPDPEVKKPDPEVKKPDPEPTKKPDPVVKKPDPEPAKPDAAALTLEMPGTLNLQVGGFTKILPLTIHRNGVKGAVAVKFENLPTGVTIADATIPEDADRAEVDAKVTADVEITEADFKVSAVTGTAKAEFVLKIKVTKK